MAISEHKNGHFEEIRGWLQILELGSNSTIFYLLFDTHDSPGAVFIWKWEIYRPYLLVCIVQTRVQTKRPKVKAKQKVVQNSLYTTTPVIKTSFF